MEERGEGSGTGERSNSKEEVKTREDYKSNREYYENEWLPIAMLYGMTYEQFWESNVRIVLIFQKAFIEKQKQIDMQMWQMGQYCYFAVHTAVGQLFGEKFEGKYPDRPFSWPQRTAEEIEAENFERELQKALQAEEEWIRVQKRMGLE